MAQIIPFPKKIEHTFLIHLNNFLRRIDLGETEEIDVQHVFYETLDSQMNFYRKPAVEHAINIFPIDNKGMRIKNADRTYDVAFRRSIAMVWSQRVGSEIKPLIDEQTVNMYVLCQLHQFSKKLKDSNFNPRFLNTLDNPLLFPEFNILEDMLEKEFAPRGLLGHEYIIINENGLVDVSSSNSYGLG
ncbi:hypothetical protein KY308_02820 [Candidatus Woesearchaeota archaeon]|nr:hypothetical protein [Candidatus Woesearchaeota archaeon]